MKKIKCDKCGKTIEGHTQNQIEHMLIQHQIGSKCQNKKEKVKTK